MQSGTSNDRTIYAELLLHRLVPTRENDSKGFAEDILIITAPNASELHRPALKLLRWTLWDCTLGHLEDFARSNFFFLCPLSFQEDPKQLKQNNYDGYPLPIHRTLNAGQYQQKGLSSTEREVCTN
ncbi:hypothetical protein BLNAU_23278 [Blattamonas nauphoetae]|uniref:Uncharacterized protein n=1 Tax=Blattamonas nauphoetae TaxID=2049346 RepID=A0ABQ9WQS4_9EUKA|nr:hypothetical protein BLNAU_23278 [Blattamonas nauphoetae]